MCTLINSIHYKSVIMCTLINSLHNKVQLCTLFKVLK
jgi:hypothetical protein